MTKEKIFKTKRGLVSAYGLACGHYQIVTINNIDLMLYQDGGCCSYNVKLRNESTGERLDGLSFDTLAGARAQFATFKRNLKKAAKCD
jgi:hypothetical protein